MHIFWDLLFNSHACSFWTGFEWLTVRRGNPAICQTFLRTFCPKGSQSGHVLHLLSVSHPIRTLRTLRRRGGDPNPSGLQSPFPNICINMGETAQASMTNTENCSRRWKCYYSERVTWRVVAPHYISSSFLLHGVPLDTRWEGLQSASLAAERQSTVLGEKHYRRRDTIEHRELPITLCAILPSRLWITVVCADCVWVTEG